MAVEENNNEEVNNTEIEETAKKGGLITKLGALKFPILIAIVVLLAVGTALMITKSAKGDAVSAKKEDKQEDKKKELGKFITLDPFTVNLMGGTNYLQTAIAFEIKAENKDLEKEIGERKPQINDAVITILSAKTIDEINTAADREELKSEIKKAVDSMLGYGKIERVYFATFIMQ